MLEKIQKHIEKAVRESIETEYNKLKVELMHRLDEDKDAVLAGISLNVMKTIEFHHLEDRLVIELKTQKLSE